VVLHHPPTPGLTPLLAGLALQNAAELLDICSSAGVLAIIAGHYHHPLVTAERGVPLIIAPGIANTTDVHAPAGRERAKTGSGYAVIDIPLGGSTAAPRVTIHAAPAPGDGQVIFDLDADQVAAIVAKAGPTGATN
jgi:3',5'-cyclic AMP phosphodiesterase CpdA